MDTKPVFHGSDIEKICSYYNLKKENIVKFGANVNPLGLSPKAGRAIAEHVDILSSYPDREYTSLRNTISSYCNIPADFILPGNGSSELISLLIQERAPKHTLILGPTYSEYSRELSFSGSTQEYYHLQESNDFEPDIPDLCRKLEQGYDFLILCNPNNPTGSLAEPGAVAALLEACSRVGAVLVVDECFLPFTDAPSCKGLLARYPNLIVLRAFTKLYAMAGLRLGYLLCSNGDLAGSIAAWGQCWSVSTPAQTAGLAALGLPHWEERTRQYLRRSAPGWRTDSGRGAFRCTLRTAPF